MKIGLTKKLSNLADLLDKRGLHKEASELDEIIKSAVDKATIDSLKKRLREIDDDLAYTPPEHKEPLLNEKFWTESKIKELEGAEEKDGGNVTDIIDDWFHSFGNRITGNARSRGEKITTSEIVELEDDTVVTLSGSRYKLGNPDRLQAIVQLRISLSQKGVKA